MKRVLIGVAATIVMFAMLVPLVLYKPSSISSDDSDQKLGGEPAPAITERRREYIEKRILGISYLMSTYANSSSTIPAVLIDQARDDQNVLSTTKVSLEKVINLLDSGEIEAANTAYQLIKQKTDKATAKSLVRRNKIRSDFRAALDHYYRNGSVYTEPEWQTLKSGVRSRLTDRATQNAREAYLMQPADNIQLGYLIDQLELLGEAEQVVFFYKLDYEISYKLFKNHGALSSALNYGVALQKFTQDSALVVDVLKGPVTRIMNASTVEIARYYEPLNAYLSALDNLQRSQEFEQFSQTIIDSVKSSISLYDKQWEDAAALQAITPRIKAEARVNGAKELYRLNIVDDAITLLDEAKQLSKGSNTQNIAEIDRLLEEYQQGFERK